MTRRTRLVCLLAIAGLLPLLAAAEHTRQWRQTDFSDFGKGTAKGVAIRSDGKLLPAPKFDPLADPNLAYLWELRMDSRRRLYAAGGPDAKVVRFDDAGKVTTVFESSELAAQTIAFDSKDNLYVGTSPDGKVYKVTPDGQKSVFFDPKTKYIWGIRVDSQGFLFVATGDKGEVFVVSPEGKGQLFYQSTERHARSLAFDAKGDLLIGTEPNGLVLRVELQRKAAGPPAAGTSFVIYETNKSEVTSLLTDTSGNLYAASVGEKIATQTVPRILPGIPAQSATPAVSTQGLIVLQGQAVTNQQAVSFPFPAVTGGAEVVKIAPDGSPETVWSSRDDLVYAMGMTPAGKLLLGTGDKGTIIELEGDQIYSTVAKAASAEVTSFVSGPGDRIYAATANAGKVFALGPGYESNGSFESNAFDARIFSHWGRLDWWGENGVMQGKVEFYARSGNTSNPDNNWSAWAGPYKASDASEAGCPPARFVQWKAVFLDSPSGAPPMVSWVGLAYQPKNVAPVIDDIDLQDPGVRLVGYAAQPNGPVNAQPVQLRMPRGPGATSSASVAAPDSSAKSPKVEVPPQGFGEKGYEGALWSAHDDNDDDLLFSVYYRGETETTWHLLKDKLAQKFYSWDTASMPDGAYYLKVVASDGPSNPADRALSTERQSDRFEIANTPPRIENLRADANTGTVKISFVGISSAGPIQQAQYSLDAGDWQILLPVGQISDSARETYGFEIASVAAGGHVVAVQVTDGFSNTTASKVAFSVSSRASK
jgi:hypothetical protein